MSYAVGRLFCCIQVPLLLLLPIHVAGHNTHEGICTANTGSADSLGDGVVAYSGLPDFWSNIVYSHSGNLVCRCQYCPQVMYESSN